MSNQIFRHNGDLFCVRANDGVMTSYEGSSGTTTVFTLFIHDVHAAVSDAVDREGVWVPVVTIDWREIRDEMDLEASGPQDLEAEDINNYISEGAYEDLIEVTSG